MTITRKHVVFLLLFLTLAFISMNINFSKIVGEENQYFTVFQFFAPMAGAFIGTPLGAIVLFLAQVINALFKGNIPTWLALVRMMPIIIAAYYFARLTKKTTMSKALMIIIPILAMVIFMTHPIARGAWYYSLYWLIPIGGVLLPTKIPGILFIRSIGATFTAHAVGSIIWLYTVPMTAAQWSGLVPVVAIERLIFALGIMASYIVMNTVLDRVSARLPTGIIVDKSYTIPEVFKALSS